VVWQIEEGSTKARKKLKTRRTFLRGLEDFPKRAPRGLRLSWKEVVRRKVERLKIKKGVTWWVGPGLKGMVPPKAPEKQGVENQGDQFFKGMEDSRRSRQR